MVTVRQPQNSRTPSVGRKRERDKEKERKRKRGEKKKEKKDGLMEQWGRERERKERRNV